MKTTLVKVDNTNIEYIGYYNMLDTIVEQIKECSYEKSMIIANEMLELQGQKGNYDYDEYMLGLYNGMEYIVSLLEVRR